MISGILVAFLTLLVSHYSLSSSLRLTLFLFFLFTSRCFFHLFLSFAPLDHHFPGTAINCLLLFLLVVIVCFSPFSIFICILLLTCLYYFLSFLVHTCVLVPLVIARVFQSYFIRS
jgi:hypothetical protein